MSDVMAVNANQTDSTTASSFLASTKSAVESGIADARASVEEAWPKIADAVGNGIYNSAYGIAFGLTFPILLIAKSIPQNNCVVWGFVDGAKAAHAQTERTLIK